MRDAIVEGEGECEVVVGLTAVLKSVLMAACIVPRYLIDVYLLWLGCRWLAATPSFGDLLLNAAPRLVAAVLYVIPSFSRYMEPPMWKSRFAQVALEFILLLKDTLYAGVVPDRNKRATQNTLIQPWQKKLGQKLCLFGPVCFVVSERF